MPLATNETEADIAFVGAGPGDPDLLTLKAQRLIARADVIIYADSLVSPDVCLHAKAEATIYRSAAKSGASIERRWTRIIGRSMSRTRES